MGLRQVAIRAVILIVGVALIGGALTHYLPRLIVPETLRPLDRYVGTEGSVVGAVLGVALLRVAVAPHVEEFWVWLTIAYGAAVALVEFVAHFTIGRVISLAPIVFGFGAAGILLALLFPRTGRAGESEAPPQEDVRPDEAGSRPLEPEPKNLR